MQADGFSEPSSGNRPAARPQARGEIQPEAALERLAGLRDLYADVVGQLLDDHSGMRGRLKAAVASGDLAAVHLNAHGLKGLAAMCGAQSLVEAAQQLENAAKAGDRGRAADLWSVMEVEFEAAATALAPYRRK